jgi:chromosome segregation and condensation protein ScpB
MRTTLNIEEDVLRAVKEIAQQRGMTVGRVLSDLARKSLIRKAPVSKKHGLPLFPIQTDAKVVTLELVNQLREESA